MSERRAWRGRWIWLAGGLILLGALVALLLWGPTLYRLLSNQEQVRTWVLRFGAWGPAVIIALEMVQVLLAPIPGQAVGMVSGYLFGPWWGTFYAMAGLVAGSTLGFALVRWLGRPLLRRWLRPTTLDRLDNLARRGGILFFFFVWLVPFTPDDLACLAAALTPMPLYQFLIAMPLARLPGVFASVWAGANATALNSTLWILLLLAIALTAIAVWRWGERIQRAVLRSLERPTGRSGQSGTTPPEG